MYYVYAIASRKRTYIYVGFTNNLERRLFQHNNGYERTTKPYAPFEITYFERCNIRLEARKREKYWKSGIGRERLKEMKNTNK